MSGWAAGAARSPLTCGELVQGAIAGRDFLISCPVRLWSRARVRLETGAAGDSVSVTVRHVLFPPGACRALPGPAKKAVRALETTLAALGTRPRRAVIDLVTPGLPGKGLGTSTADVLATAAATAAALGRPLAPEQLARLALGIEPSDSTMFPGLALLDHRRGTLMKALGPAPEAGLVMVDLGGEVDTEQFNHRPDLDVLNREKEPLVREALRLVCRGIRCGDPGLVGRGATISALAHQIVLPRAGLPELVREACRLGALGVVGAHSGTVVGFLVPARGDAARRLAGLLTGWPGASVVVYTSLTGGGVRAWGTADGCGRPPVDSGSTPT